MSFSDTHSNQFIQSLLQSEKLPSWAQWLAQDADGTWWAYEDEPNQHHQGWYENEVGDSVRVIQTESNSEWQQTLIKVK